MYFDVCTMHLVQLITRVYKMHGTYIKIVEVQQATMYNIYKNTKIKLQKTYAVI